MRKSEKWRAAIKSIYLSVNSIREEDAMTKLDILKIVAGVHNRISCVLVSGDNTVLIGDSIRELRSLGEALQRDIESEDAKSAKESKGESGGDEEDGHGCA